MLRLEKISGKNVWDILRLRVAENQKHFVSENEVARCLYRSFGFVENGEMDGDEVIAVLKL